MIRANTGNAVMAMAAPRNSVASNRETPATNSSGTVISHGVAIIATRKGTTVPDTDTATALGAFDLKSSLRSSPCRRRCGRPTRS